MANLAPLPVEIMAGVYLGLLVGIIPALAAWGMGFIFKYFTGVTLPGLARGDRVRLVTDDAQVTGTLVSARSNGSSAWGVSSGGQAPASGEPATVTDGDGEADDEDD